MKPVNQVTNVLVEFKDGSVWHSPKNAVYSMTYDKHVTLLSHEDGVHHVALMNENVLMYECDIRTR